MYEHFAYGDGETLSEAAAAAIEAVDAKARERKTLPALDLSSLGL